MPYFLKYKGKTSSEITLTKDCYRPLGSPSFPRCGRFGSVDSFTAAASSYEDSPRWEISLRDKFKRVVDAPNTADQVEHYVEWIRDSESSFIFNSKLFFRLGHLWKTDGLEGILLLYLNTISSLDTITVHKSHVDHEKIHNLGRNWKIRKGPDLLRRFSRRSDYCLFRQIKQQLNGNQNQRTQP